MKMRIDRAVRKLDRGEELDCRDQLRFKTDVRRVVRRLRERGKRVRVAKGECGWDVR